VDLLLDILHFMLLLQMSFLKFTFYIIVDVIFLDTFIYMLIYVYYNFGSCIL
jgi:hypothetical protein